MSVRAKSNLGKLTGAAGVIRAADKKQVQNTSSTKSAEGNLKAKSKK